MRLGMMQPYFFPYLGYFSLIAATDRWVVFDTPQYMRRSWVNRNRVLSSGRDGWKYVRVPVSKLPRDTPICEMRITDCAGLRESILRNLDEYERRNAPWFDETVCMIDDCLACTEDRLSTLLVRCLRKTCAHLLLPFAPELFSETDLPIANVGAGDWALETAVALGATEYINPPGGWKLFDPDEFHRCGVTLTFLQHDLPPYSQRRPEFLAGLSIIDVLMWNGRSATRQMIDDFRLITPEEAAAGGDGTYVRRSA